MQVSTRIELDSKTTVSFFGMYSTFFPSTKFLVKRKNAGKFMLKKHEQKLKRKDLDLICSRTRKKQNIFVATSGNDDVGEIFPNETGYVYICQHEQTQEPLSN